MSRRSSIDHSGRKRALEKGYLEAFLDMAALEYTSVVHRDRPDFIVDTAAGRIGVEVTTLNKKTGRRGSRIVQKESAHQRFLADLSSAYYALGGQPLQVKIATDRSLDTVQLNTLADRLRELRPADGLQLRITDCHDLTLYLRALPAAMGEYRHWIWLNDHIGWNADADFIEIDSVIQHKTVRSSGYTDDVTSLYLLIVADHLRVSGMLRLPVDRFVLSPHSFERIYLFEYPEAIHRLA